MDRDKSATPVSHASIDAFLICDPLGARDGEGLYARIAQHWWAVDAQSNRGDNR